MAKKPSPDELMGSREICRELDVNPSTVARWARSGVLPVAIQRPGRNGALLFRRGDVEKFAALRDEGASA